MYLLKGSAFSFSECKFVALSTKCMEMCALACVTATNFTFIFQLKNQTNACKHTLCWPHQLFGILLGGFGMITGFRHSMKRRIHDEKCDSMNFRSSSHTEGDRCQQALLYICRWTLNFNFLWTASEYTFPLFWDQVKHMIWYSVDIIRCDEFLITFMKIRDAKFLIIQIWKLGHLYLWQSN